MTGDLLERVRDAFEDVYARAFRGDPAANPRLTVEALPAFERPGVTGVMLVTPWTINGLVLTSELPASVVLAGRPTVVHALELPTLGRFGSVNVIADVSRLTSPTQARTLAASWVPPFDRALAACCPDRYAS